MSKRKIAVKTEVGQTNMLPSDLPEPYRSAEELRESLKAIQEFCDDPNGSDKSESLAMGLARMLPAARALLSRMPK